MNSNPRDLDTPYPLVPEQGMRLSPAGEALLDICLYLTLPAADLEAGSRSIDSAGVVRNRSLCTAYVLNVYRLGQQTSASVLVHTAFAPAPVAISVPIYIGRDSLPPAGSSYAIMDEWPAADDGVLDVAHMEEDSNDGAVPVEIHPGCLVIMQDAPVVRIYTRTNIGKEVDAQDTGVPIVSELAQEGLLSLVDGHNATVEDIDGTLVLTAAGGLGKGVFTIPPYIDVPADPGYAGVEYKGLRTIDGLPGALAFTGSNTFSVTTTDNDTTRPAALPTETGVYLTIDLTV